VKVFPEQQSYDHRSESNGAKHQVLDLLSCKAQEFGVHAKHCPSMTLMSCDFPFGQITAWVWSQLDGPPTP
jgi:hypothetical protein